MKCTPDGTITNKNKCCGEGLPATNGMTDKRERNRGEAVLMRCRTTVTAVYHPLNTTRGQVGNGTIQIGIKSQARKSLGNSIKGKKLS